MGSQPPYGYDPNGQWQGQPPNSYPPAPPAYPEQSPYSPYPEQSPYPSYGQGANYQTQQSGPYGQPGPASQSTYPPPPPPAAYSQPLYAPPSVPYAVPMPGMPMPQTEPGRGMAVAGLVLGIVSIVLALLSFLFPIGCVVVDFVTSVLAIIFGAIGLRSQSRRAMGAWGLALGIISIPLMIVVIVIYFAIVVANSSGNGG